MYHRLPYHQAVRLRQYRLDQYSENFRRVRFNNVRRLRFTSMENVPAQTAIDIYGKEGMLRREFVQTGKALAKVGNTFTIESRSDQFNSFYWGGSFFLHC